VEGFGVLGAHGKEELMPTRYLPQLAATGCVPFDYNSSWWFSVRLWQQVPLYIISLSLAVGTK